MSEFTVSTLVLETITKYHTSGSNAGQVKYRRSGINIGASFARYGGVEANLKAGFYWPRN